MNKLAEKGVCIVMVSSDLPEVISMSDRVLVMCEGEITGEFTKTEVSQEKVMACATGITKSAVKTL